MAFKGQDSITGKILIFNKIIEQVHSFTYLGNLLCFGKEVHNDKELNNRLKITTIINNVFRPQENFKENKK